MTIVAWISTSRGAVSLENITADSNTTSNGVYIENCNYSSGACLGSGDVTLTGTLVFTNNGDNDDGLYISSSGNVSMADVTATGNGDEGVQISNTGSTTNAFVLIGGTNVFTGNRGYGLYVTSKGAITASNVTADGSVNDSGAYLDNDETGAVGGVTLTGTNSFNGNYDYGLEIDSRGAVSLNNITADNNITQFGVNIYNGGTSASGDVTITGTNSFSGNDDYGLVIGSRGTVSINNVTADGNKTQDGVNIDNDAGTGDVTLTGTLSFSNNGNGDGDDGLYIDTKGNVAMANVVATGNKDEGVEIYNTDSTTNAFVQIDGTNLFSGNTGNGLYVLSKGDIILSNVTSDGSVNDSGAYLNNNQSGAVGGIAVTGTNSFSGNNDWGLQVYSRGAVTLENITADGNKTQDGTYIDNDPTGATGDVTIRGTNSFSGNGNGDNDDGLYITSRGNILLENITADSNTNFGGYITNTASSSGATVTMNGVNVINNNADDGLIIYSDGTIQLNEITADGNGTGNADNGAELRNDLGTADVIISGYYNSFSNNTGPGLDVYTRGNIELHFATVTGNNTASGSLNGAQFITPGTTSNSARIYCSIFGNNKGYGLNASSFENSLTFVGQNSFSGNSSGDYSFNGTPSFENPDFLCEEPVLGCMDPTAFNYNPEANTEDGSCVPVILGCMKPNHPDYDPQANTPTKCTVDQTLSSFLVPVTGSEPFALSCETPMTKLQMLNGDFVIFGDLCGYDAVLDAIPEDGLPDELSNGAQYASGLNVTLLQDGTGVDPLPDGMSMTVAFQIPSGMETESFAILRWDGGSWVEENVSLADGYVMTTSTTTGTFILVVK